MNATKAKNDWRVEWRLKKSPLKCRTSAWVSKERALKIFNNLKKLNYRCWVGFYQRGPIPLFVVEFDNNFHLSKTEIKECKAARDTKKAS